MTKIALVPGQVGFYDDLSGVRLSLENTEATIAPGINTAGLIEAVKAGKITVISGSLGTEALAVKDAVEAIPTYYRLLEKKKKKQIRAQIINIAGTPVEPVVEAKVEPVIEPVEPKEDSKIEVDVEVIEQATEQEAEKVEAEVVVEEVTETKKKTTRKKKEEVKED